MDNSCVFGIKKYNVKVQRVIMVINMTPRICKSLIESYIKLENYKVITACLAKGLLTVFPGLPYEGRPTEGEGKR